MIYLGPIKCTILAKQSLQIPSVLSVALRVGQIDRTEMPFEFQKTE